MDRKYTAALDRLQVMIARLVPEEPSGDGEQQQLTIPNYDVADILESIRQDACLDGIFEMPKHNLVADKLRTDGNRFYAERKFDHALMHYNQSTCYAEVGSEQIGMGYGNRSAVLFEQGEYELALYSIDLAKKHNYPERLMPKLLAREYNCKQRIADGYSKGTVPKQRMGINVDTNPRIPFLASGIGMSYDSKFGRGLVAEKDFNPGDVICDEPIEFCGVEPTLAYRYCSQCSADPIQTLIPCPTCPMAMFCSEECRELNWKLYHRYECAVASKLMIVSSVTNIIYPRLFFYGLSQFGDDLQAMMDYCESEVPVELNPLEIDFANLNRLEVFKAYYSIKTCNDQTMDNDNKIIASMYYLAFMENPLVSSIISTEDQRQFFLRTLIACTHSFSSSTTAISIEGHTVNLTSPVVSLCNHSCDPNATTIVHYGRRKMVLLRPVRNGEQIFTYYGPSWWNPDPREASVVLNFNCQCVVCDRESMASQDWHSKKMRLYPIQALKNLLTMADVCNSDDTNVAAKLNALRQFFRRFSVFHPHQILGSWLNSYCDMLNECTYAEDEALIRAKLQTDLL